VITPPGDLIARMRARMPLVAWAALLFLVASVLFTIWAFRLWTNAEERRKGPDPYGEQDLAALRADPLMNVSNEQILPRGEPHENISNYICVVCDFFPTGIGQSYDLNDEPSAAIATLERTAKSSGWTVVERSCTTDPAVATLVVEKNFEDFHTSTLFEVSVQDDGAGVHAGATINHEHRRTRARRADSADCLDEKWRNLAGSPASTGSG